MQNNENLPSFKMRKISPLRFNNKSKTLPTGTQSPFPFRNSNMIKKDSVKIQLGDNDKKRISNLAKTEQRMGTNQQLSENDERQNKIYQRYSRVSINKRILPSKKNTFFNQKNCHGRVPLKIRKNKFQYYISDVVKGLEKYSKSEEQSLFISHIIFGMHAIRSTKYVSVPLKPHINVKIGWKAMKFERTLIFDLDETLIHSIMESNASYYPHQKQILIEGGLNESIVTMYINFRPFLFESFNQLGRYFNIAVFTAGSQQYATKILDQIDLQGQIFAFRLFREHCIIKNGHQKIKDLRILDGINLQKTLLIDNSPYSALYQKDNLVPILPFTDDEKDDQLKKLSEYLIKNFANNQQNFKQTVKKHFRISEYDKYSTLKQLVQKLYSDFI